MGTEAYIEVIYEYGEKRRAALSIAHAIDLCFEKIRIFSRFDPESELSRLNARLGAFMSASPDMLAVARHALSFYRESNGLFDPRILSVLNALGYSEDFSHTSSRDVPEPKIVPTRSAPLRRDLKIWGEMIRFDVPMDFSGISKGYILDAMAHHIEADGWKHFLVDAGGDMVAHGLNREEIPWRVDVERIPETELLLSLSNKALATSGITRRHWHSLEGDRYHHLIHPKRPYDFSFDLLSVTAVSKSAERADFLAKTLFLMGKKRGLASAIRYSIPAVFVENEDMPRWHASAEMKKYLAHEKKQS